MSAIVMYSAGRASVLQETVSFWDVNSSPIFFWKSMLYQISPNPEAGLLALEYSSSRLTSWHSWWYCLSVQETQETWAPSLGQEDPLKEEWQPTPAFLPGKFHGQRSLVGFSLWGCRVGHDWWSSWAHLMVMYPERYVGMCVCACTCVSEKELRPTANDACSKMTTFWDLPGGSVVKTLLPLQGLRIQSLVGKLKPYMLCGVAK